MEDPKNLIPQQPIIQPEVINLPKHGTPEAYAYAYAEYGFKRIAKLEEDITEAKNTGNTAGIAKAESEITKMKGMMAESLQILEKGGITIPKATTNILEKKEVTYSPLLSINLNWYAEESGG
ncbi:MAG TPA: hypothetical protein VGO21_04390, partial [Candidatus Paceibacterota bacterium]|nr:hypothetical protein [Candidatus Paceibacterota bacterium]